jgi:hypothetical protein
MASPHCTVIILNWNGKQFLAGCLASLRQQTFRNFDVLLVDNGSQDGSVDYVTREFPEVRTLQLSENLGFCRPNNLGMEDAMARGSDFVLLLNNDTKIAADCLERMMAAMAENPKVAVVCPKIYFADHPDTFWYAGADFTLWTSRSRYTGWRQKDRGQFDEPRSITQATGCAMLVRVCALKEVGLLNERFWAYVEDVDWSIRFLQSSHQIRFEPKARVWHFDGGTSVGRGSQFRRQYLSTRNLLLLGREHAKWWQIPTFLLGFLFFHVAFYAALRFVRRDFLALRAIGEGIIHALRPGSLAPNARLLGLSAPRRS